MAETRTSELWVPDEIVNVVFTGVLGDQQAQKRVTHYTGSDLINIYYVLLQVSKQFRRVGNSFCMDWHSLWVSQHCREREIKPGKSLPSRFWERLAYHDWRCDFIKTKVDHLTSSENVIYRSPILGCVTKNKIAMGKLRKATFPNKAIKDKAMSLLLDFERTKRQNLKLRKEYFVEF